MEEEMRDTLKYFEFNDNENTYETCWDVKTCFEGSW